MTRPVSIPTGPQAPQGSALTTRLRPDRRRAAGSGQGQHASACRSQSAAHQLLGHYFNALVPSPQTPTWISHYGLSTTAGTGVGRGPFRRRIARALGQPSPGRRSSGRLTSFRLHGRPLTPGSDLPHALLLRRHGRGESAVDEERRKVSRHERTNFQAYSGRTQRHPIRFTRLRRSKPCDPKP
jgi:hypothetical protein